MAEMPRPVAATVGLKQLCLGPPATQLFTSLQHLGWPSAAFLHGRLCCMSMCSANTCPATAAWQRPTPWGLAVQGSDMATVQAWADGGLVTGAILFRAVFLQPHMPLAGIEIFGPGYKAVLFMPG